MNLQDAIYGRRSVREYTRDPVDDGLLRRLIDAAIHAPSAVNEQPWSFTVVRDQALLERISREAKAYMLGTLSTDPTSNHLRRLLSDANFQIFYHAPALVLISAVSESPWAIEDCALAAENLMLSAYAAGLCS
jgi:nitroreductase